MSTTGADNVPWPPAEWEAMQNEASIWRAKWRALPDAGTLFLLDGASCSGKSTLVDRLAADATLPLELVLRYSTRQRRPDDQPRREYLFVSRERFLELARAGGFIEYRDFQFGMSYGLPWAEAFAPLLKGRHGLAIINLGNVRHVKALLPEAVTILVDAPLETIRQRLIARGVNTPEQIEERLTNAARVEMYRPFYDHVVRNDDGTLTEAQEFLRALVLSRTAHSKTSPSA
jgi:guanylate kinase